MPQGPDIINHEAARRVLGEAPSSLSPPMSDQHELAVQGAMAEMAATISAVKAWRDQCSSSTPQPAAAPSRTRSRAWWAAGISAAAAAIFAVFLLLPRLGPSDSHQNLVVAPQPFDWPGTLPARQPAPEPQSVAMRFSPAEDAGSVGGGTAKGAPGRGNSEAGPETSPATDLFVRQFSFPFAVPTTLPPAWHFVRARPLAADRVQLIYASGNHTIEIFLTPDIGPDVPFKSVQHAGQPLVIGRHRNTAIAFRGGVASPEMWNKIANQLTLLHKD